MIIEIEIPDELEEYRDDLISYAIEAIRIKIMGKETKLFTKTKKR